MTITNDDVDELRAVAGSRWPTEIPAGAESTWTEWRKSLERFEFVDVMAALILLGETSERFPALARLIVAVQVARDERQKAERPLLDAPKPVTTVAKRLEAFDRSAAEDRVRRRAELAVFERRHHVDGVDARLVAIDEVGPWEAKAREWIARGVDPLDGCRAFIAQFHANGTGDPGSGLGTDAAIVF